MENIEVIQEFKAGNSVMKFTVAFLSDLCISLSTCLTTNLLTLSKPENMDSQQNYDNNPSTIGGYSSPCTTAISVMISKHQTSTEICILSLSNICKN
jgi:hypothetical protein